MFRKLGIPLLFSSVALFMAHGQTWKDKQVSEWSDEDARLILNDSPWVRRVMPVVEPQQAAQPRRQAAPPIRIGRGGMPRIGGVRFPRNPTPPTPRRTGANNPNAPANQPPELTLRWESAEPVRNAELRARDSQTPSIDQKKYAIAVYGITNRFAPGDSQSVLNKLKGQAVLKRDGKKDLKPSKVIVVDRQGAPVYVFLFNRSPKKPEITEQDRRIEFDAQIGRLRFSDSFFLEDMVYQGKLQI